MAYQTPGMSAKIFATSPDSAKFAFVSYEYLPEGPRDRRSVTQRKGSPGYNPWVAIQSAQSLRCCCVIRIGRRRSKQEPSPASLAREECRIGYRAVDCKANRLVDSEALQEGVTAKPR